MPAPSNDQIHNTPIYPVADAARYLQIPAPTLRTWLTGRTYPTQTGPKTFAPIIQRPAPNLPQLSFTNLIEAHVLRAIREYHSIRLDKAREAIDYLSQEFNTPHPLAQIQFQTDRIDLFIESVGRLINASRSGQLVMRDSLKHFLTRIDWNKDGIAERLFPFVQAMPGMSAEDKPLIIDPRISFGRPVIAGTGIPTHIVAELYDAGDSIEDIADEYDCQPAQIHTAIWFESRNQAA